MDTTDTSVTAKAKIAQAAHKKCLRRWARLTPEQRVGTTFHSWKSHLVPGPQVVVTVSAGDLPAVKCSECGHLGSDQMPVYNRNDALRLAEQHRESHL